MFPRPKAAQEMRSDPCIIHVFGNSRRSTVAKKRYRKGRKPAEIGLATDQMRDPFGGNLIFPVHPLYSSKFCIGVSSFVLASNVYLQITQRQSGHLC